MKPNVEIPVFEIIPGRKFAPMHAFPALRNFIERPTNGEYYVRCEKPKKAGWSPLLSSSQYWHGEDDLGAYKIRYSNHWGMVGKSVFLIDDTNCRRKETEFICGKVYLKPKSQQ